MILLPTEESVGGLLGLVKDVTHLCYALNRHSELCAILALFFFDAFRQLVVLVAHTGLLLT